MSNMYRTRPLVHGLRSSSSSTSAPSSSSTFSVQFYGYVLLVGCFLFFVLSMYTIVVAKFMPATSHPLLDFFINDYYYCLLVPMLIPVTIVAVYLNWLGLKYFRHTH